MKSRSFIFKTKYQIILLVFIALGLNANTLFHDYALDDIVVLTENNYVKKGIKGIPEILTTDYIAGYSKQENILTGARYRPFSLIIFALEYQFFGANPFVSHLINIILFALLIYILYRFLKQVVFQGQHNLLAFITCLFFTVHPIHTEIIANVKGRDEIITSIFLILSLLTLVNYFENSATKNLFASLIFFVLALLTKESAVTFLGVIPLVIYFFLNQTLKRSFVITIPYILIFAGYMCLRYFIVGLNDHPVNDVTNSPYIYATTTESFATKTYILFKYISLLFFPFPLSSDYGYNQIPYINLFSFPFIISFLVLASLIFVAIADFKQRKMLSFCIFFFFITISLGTNLIIDLGTTMAERMLFIPSLAFSILSAILIIQLFNYKKVLTYFLTGIISIVFSIKTIARNNAWKNNETLFLTDVKSSPDCARLNLYACEQLIIKANNESDAEKRNMLLDQAIQYGKMSLQIHSEFAYSYLRLSIAYYHKGEFQKSAKLTETAQTIEPNDQDVKNWATLLSDFFYKEGNKFLDQQKISTAINLYTEAVNLNANNSEAWYNIGGCYLLINDTTNGMKAWQKVRILEPNHKFDMTEFSK